MQIVWNHVIHQANTIVLKKNFENQKNIHIFIITQWCWIFFLKSKCFYFSLVLLCSSRPSVWVESPGQSHQPDLWPCCLRSCGSPEPELVPLPSSRHSCPVKPSKRSRVKSNLNVFVKYSAPNHAKPLIPHRQKKPCWVCVWWMRLHRWRLSGRWCNELCRQSLVFERARKGIWSTGKQEKEKRWQYCASQPWQILKISTAYLLMLQTTMHIIMAGAESKHICQLKRYWLFRFVQQLNFFFLWCLIMFLDSLQFLRLHSLPIKHKNMALVHTVVLLVKWQEGAWQYPHSHKVPRWSPGPPQSCPLSRWLKLGKSETNGWIWWDLKRFRLSGFGPPW